VPLPLADPGPVVRFGQPITKLILNICRWLLPSGSLVLASFAANDDERARLQPVASWAASIWLFAGAANFIFTYLSASGSEMYLWLSVQREPVAICNADRARHTTRFQSWLRISLEPQHHRLWGQEDDCG
jgi:hypothetical protein